ncbi:gliding motility protein GldN [Ornithobacterium rhinotracheale H06-030791]|nr:gliding motility protein GldN [Ornithobacterium rhinotracheale ORT-UMN 88]KGB66839.1 gliding motility protein GldN [Ornithobacterium rhinotracheale H06-030791]
MKMKYKLLSLTLILLGAIVNAQSVLNAKSPEELRRMRAENVSLNSKGDTIPNADEPMPYGYIDDNDVLWSKVVWEIIDMNEKLNQPYYNSSNGIAYSTLSLFDALKKGIESGEIKEVYDDEFFEHKLTPQEALNSLSRTDTTDWYYEQKEAGVDMSKVQDTGIDRYPVGSDKVKMIKIKGMWYIDRRIGEMRYRILGISMMGPDAQSMGRGFDGADDYVDLFWIWYPDARKVLNRYKVFNSKNASSKVTFDDMLNGRRFNTVIYKASDMMGNRSIDQFIPKDAEAQLEASRKIKEEILQKENEMWNY